MPYSYLVTNTGNVALTGVTVVDDKVASVNCPKTTLAIGESMTCTGTHVVTQAEMNAGGNLVNLASADSIESLPALDSVTIPIAQTRSLTIDKSSTSNSVTFAGQVIPYSYLVTNTGNVTLSNVTVTDDKVASVSCPSTPLAPGGSFTCTGNHTVTQAEINAGGSLVNIARAQTGTTVSPPDSVTIPITQTRSLTIDKSSTTNAVTTVGQVMPYWYLVTNTGNVTLSSITVTDDKVPTVTCPTTPLAPGGSFTCTGNHTVTSAEINAGGSLVNIARAQSGTTVSPPDSVSIPITQTRSLTIDKSSTSNAVTSAGQQIPYSYLVTNTGNVSLSNVTVTDDKVPTVTCPTTPLAPGASMTCTGNHMVTQAEIDAGGTLVNIARAQSGTTVSPPDSVTIPITQTRSLSIDKSSTSNSVTTVGQQIPYTYLVRNTGNVTLTNITVTDDKVATVTCPTTPLAPNATMTCTGTHTSRRRRSMPAAP